MSERKNLRIRIETVPQLGEEASAAFDRMGDEGQLGHLLELEDQIRAVIDAHIDHTADVRTLQVIIEPADFEERFLSAYGYHQVKYWKEGIYTAKTSDAFKAKGVLLRLSYENKEITIYEAAEDFYERYEPDFYEFEYEAVFTFDEADALVQKHAKEAQ